MLDVHADDEPLLSCLLMDSYGRNRTFAIVSITTSRQALEDYITATQIFPVEVNSKDANKATRSDQPQSGITPIFSNANFNSYIHANGTSQKPYLLDSY